MRVTFTDPEGPRYWRRLPYLLPGLVFLLALVGLLPTAAAVLTSLAALALFNLVGALRYRQRTPRVAELVSGPGWIEITQAGSRNQRIHTKDITGGTTARTRNGVLLTLQHAKRDQPVLLEVANEADVTKIRHALGIGHGGFGTLLWRTESDNTARAAFIGRLAAAIATIASIALVIALPRSQGIGVAMFLGQISLIGTIIGVVGLFARGPQPSVVMAADGLRLRTLQGWFALPYHALRHLEPHLRGLAFHIEGPFPSILVHQSAPLLGGPSEAEVKGLLAQIKSASQRARGLGAHKEDVRGRIDVLRRRGESPRDWLVRLDMAGQMLSAGPGYRGNTLDVEDLWAILEDPDAEPELRAAAARVLRHSPAEEARVRIDAAVAAVRDDATNRRLRIAIRDDLDGASQELAFLDATEPRPPQVMRMQHGARG